MSVPLGQPGHALFTVCDGHGGAEVARYGALNLVRDGPHRGRGGLGCDCLPVPAQFGSAASAAARVA